MDNLKIASVIPLGKLNPPAHTFPTDHIYLYFTGVTNAGTPVYAAAGGVVTMIYKPDTIDYKIVIKVDQSFYYYYDHLWSLNSGIATGSTVTAGQQLGLAGGGGGSNAAAMDMGVLNYNQTLSGVASSCRFIMSIHTESPVKYFGTSDQTTLRAKVTKTGIDKDGKIDFDIPGKLSGAWFVEGTPTSGSGGPTFWAKQLMFGYDLENPTQMRISVGGTIVSGTSGALYGVGATDLDFSLVDPNSGLKLYELYPSIGGAAPNIQQSGWMLVKMLTSSRIQVEIVNSVVPTPSSFSQNSTIYTRD